MAKYLNLQIPEGCHEDWHAMLPDRKGKFCTSCQKQVIDFTNMSDGELVAFFKNQKSNTCGRFTSDQLGRDILIPRRPIPWIKYFFQFTLPAFLLSLKASAQTTGRIKPPIEVAPVTKGEVASIIDSAVVDTTTVKGTISDDAGRPIVGASILLKGTRKGTVADTLGRFSLQGVQVPATIIITSIGYTAQELHVSSSQRELNVRLNQQRQGLVGGLIVVKSRRPKKLKKMDKKELCVTPVNPSLSVYPNPLQANNPLHLKWQGLEEGNYSIELFSVSGALLYNQTVTIESWMKEYAIEPQGLKAGSYIAKLTHKKNGKHLSQQLLVQE